MKTVLELFSLSHLGLPEDQLHGKLDEIFDEIIEKYEIDEFLLREFNKSGFNQIHLSLNNLEMNNKKLDVLEELYERTNALGKSLGVSNIR